MPDMNMMQQDARHQRHPVSMPTKHYLHHVNKTLPQR